MEAFVFHKGKIAKAIFVTFFALMGVFLTIYATCQIYNLFKIKNAFDISLSKVKNIWQKPLSALSIPHFEKNYLYYFDIKEAKDSAPSLTAVYTPDKEGNLGEISFINSKGESASLYEIMNFISSMKNTAGKILYSQNAAYRGILGYFDSRFLTSLNTESENTLGERITRLLTSDFSIPKINKSRLVYNMALLLSKMNISPGKQVPVSDYQKDIKGRKYTFEVKKEHIEAFVKRITSDGSVENTPFMSQLKSITLLFIQKCSSDSFIFNITIQKGDIHSVECVTPIISGNSYMISAQRDSTFKNISAQIENISKKENLLEVYAQSDGKDIKVLCKNQENSVNVSAQANKERTRLSFDYKNRFMINMQTQKEREGYSIDFYPDTAFARQPFLNVYMAKVRKNVIMGQS